jgi:hypothetical protein
LVISIAAFFIRKELQFPIKLSVAAIGLVSCYLAYKTGQLGGELVYLHGAASAYGHKDEVNALPSTATKQTRENISDENESHKSDENEYGNQSELPNTPEDDTTRQED